MSEISRVLVEFIGGEDPCITEELESNIDEFLERHALPGVGEYILNQLEEAFVDFGEEKHIHLPPTIVEELFEFAARFLPHSSFAVLILDGSLRGTRIREYKGGACTLVAGPFQ